MTRAGITHGAFWFQHPTWHASWRRVADRLVSVYDCDDLYEAFTDSSAGDRARARAAEASLMAAPGVAFAASPPLLEHLRSFRSPRALHLLPNVRTASEAAVAPAVVLEAEARPIIGLIGDIDDRYDFRLLAAVADAIPEATLLLAGRVSLPVADRTPSGFTALAARGNVRLTGALEPAQVPAIAAGIDVGLLPYRLTPATRHASPVKVFDYLYARVPVVATDVPDLGSAARWVRIAVDADGFVRAVRDALGAGRIGAEIEPWLLENTAEARARAALEVLAEAR
jgi:hypothetical protein